MAFESIARRGTKETPKKRSFGDTGGSLYNRVQNHRLQTLLTLTKGFQEKNKIDKMNFVNVKFDRRKKMIALSFTKEAGDTAYAIQRKDGTAYLNFTSILRKVGLKLSTNMYRAEFSYSKRDGVLIALGDNVEKYVAPKIVLKRSKRTGRILSRSIA